MSEKKLTEKNKQAIEVYLGAGSEEAKGNGGKSWQEVYGTKSLATAEVNWSRMLGNAKSRAYLEERRAEVEKAVTEQIAYDVADAVRDLQRIQQDAMKSELEEPEDEGAPAYDLGMRDRKAAIQATTELLKVQGKYVTKSESTSITGSPEDRQHAALLGLGLTEFLDRKAAGTLPPPPEIPETRTQH